MTGPTWRQSLHEPPALTTDQQFPPNFIVYPVDDEGGINWSTIDLQWSFMVWDGVGVGWNEDFTCPGGPAIKAQSFATRYLKMSERSHLASNNERVSTLSGAQPFLQFWVKVDDYDTNMTFVSHRSSSSLGFDISLTGGNLVLTTGSTTAFSIPAMVALPNGDWHLLTVHPLWGRLHVDGQLLAWSTSSFTMGSLPGFPILFKYGAGLGGANPVINASLGPLAYETDRPLAEGPFTFTPNPFLQNQWSLINPRDMIPRDAGIAVNGLPVYTGEAKHGLTRERAPRIHPSDPTLGDFGIKDFEAIEAAETYAVPAGVDEIFAIVAGGNGGASSNATTWPNLTFGNQGGTGDVAYGRIQLPTAGATIEVSVGSKGEDTPLSTTTLTGAGSIGSEPAGGWPNGGRGGGVSNHAAHQTLKYYPGAGGGGSTKIKIGGTTALEAGGGGGAGGFPNKNDARNTPVSGVNVVFQNTSTGIHPPKGGNAATLWFMPSAGQFPPWATVLTPGYIPWWNFWPTGGSPLTHPMLYDGGDIGVGGLGGEGGSILARQTMAAAAPHANWSDIVCSGGGGGGGKRGGAGGSWAVVKLGGFIVPNIFWELRRPGSGAGSQSQSQNAGPGSSDLDPEMANVMDVTGAEYMSSAGAGDLAPVTLSSVLSTTWRYTFSSTQPNPDPTGNGWARIIWVNPGSDWSWEMPYRDLGTLEYEPYPGFAGVPNSGQGEWMHFPSMWNWIRHVSDDYAYPPFAQLQPMRRCHKTQIFGDQSLYESVKVDSPLDGDRWMTPGQPYFSIPFTSTSFSGFWPALPNDPSTDGADWLFLTFDANNWNGFARTGFVIANFGRNLLPGDLVVGFYAVRQGSGPPTLGIIDWTAPAAFVETGGWSTGDMVMPPDVAHPTPIPTYRVGYAWKTITGTYPTSGQYGFAVSTVSAQVGAVGTAVFRNIGGSSSWAVSLGEMNVGRSIDVRAEIPQVAGIRPNQFILTWLFNLCAKSVFRGRANTDGGAKFRSLVSRNEQDLGNLASGTEVGSAFLAMSANSDEAIVPYYNTLNVPMPWGRASVVVNPT